MSQLRWLTCRVDCVFQQDRHVSFSELMVSLHYPHFWALYIGAFPLLPLTFLTISFLPTRLASLLVPRYFLFLLRFSFKTFFILVMSSSNSSLEKEIDEYQDVSSGSEGSYESSESSTTSSESLDEHYSSGVPGIPFGGIPGITT